MPAKAIASLLIVVIIAAGATIGLAQWLGLPMAILGVVAALAALALRLWMDRR